MYGFAMILNLSTLRATVSLAEDAVTNALQ